MLLFLLFIFLFELTKLLNSVVVAFVLAVATARVLTVATTGLARTVSLEGHALTGPVSIFSPRVVFRAPGALLLLSRRSVSVDLARLAISTRGRVAIPARNPATATAGAVLVVPPGSTAAVRHLRRCIQQLAVRANLRVRSFEQDRQLVQGGCKLPSLYRLSC